ncbi:MAG: T9SS type A sorting domain-containing protein [Candidatus Kapabacteria bacterium]|nr:T9SS type A sorting domain-containing protein [Candidatus Kapabacteria bacterium]
MNRRNAQWSVGAKIGVVLLLAALIGLGSQVLSAQTNKPELPTISLTGSGGGWNTTYYPDGRIWTSTQGSNGQRELLVPVFIKNCWRTTDTYKTFPIYSFKFKVQFDSTALELIGIDKNGPNRGPQFTPLGCLGRDFEYSVFVARDTTFQSVIGAPIQNRLRGKRAMITAISSKALPQTGDPSQPCDQRPYTELVYLRFKVVANPSINQESSRTPLIVTNDTLYYNDFQMGKELAFPGDVAPGQFAGLGGVDNYYTDGLGQEQIRDPLRPSKPGMIWLEVTDVSPRLSFTNVSNPAFRLVDSVNQSGGSKWFVVDPITIDYGSNYDDQPNGMGTRDIDVINAVTGTRAYEIMVQSDSKWLKFKSFLKGGQGEINPFPQPVREGYVQYMDKGILGTTLGVTPFGDPTVGQRDLNFRILCDPNELPNGDDQEICGTYVGYLSFKSTSLDVSPVRVKVTFIYFRTPYEPNVFDENNNWKRGQEFLGRGVTLDIRNSNNPIERTFITFGVGNRATDLVDTLFGETVYTTPVNSFGARWYPKDKTGADIYQYGLGDLWTATAQRPKGASRDIRSIYTDTTILYTCKFNAGSNLNYPVVVAWNTDEFTPGSQLFIRDILNGTRFNVDMRQGTVVGGTRQSFTIRDADIDAFVIEYTLPLVAQFPVINKGWNLLSVPVNPSSSYWKDVFKNALNIPIRFAQNSYQTNETNLAPGVGYFVKYSEQVDKTVAGSRIRNINDQSYPTRVYEGWNTIGSLSSPTSTQNVSLLPFGTGAFPAIIGDIYGYVTNRGYQAVTEIQPGLGYWMKMSGQAYLAMCCGTLGKSGVNFSGVRETVKANAMRVTISDNAENVGDVFVAQQGSLETRNVFELPPLPPNNLFDVRFSDQTYINDEASPLIQLQGATFPITVTVNNPGRSYVVTNPISGAVLGTLVSGRNNTITITDSRTPYLRLLGQDADVTALTVSVSPNPTSTTGMVNVTVPQAGRVTVGVYDAVGQLVATVVDEEKTAGIYGFDLNTATLAQGRYIVKVSSNGITAMSSVSVVR